MGGTAAPVKKRERERKKADGSKKVRLKKRKETKFQKIVTNL